MALVTVGAVYIYIYISNISLSEKIKESCKGNFAGLVVMASKRVTSDQTANLIRDG